MTVSARGRAARFTKLAVALGIAVVGSVTAGVTAATAYANSVTYTGQGAIADGFGGYALQTELCGVANGADVDGPYLLWVLTATGATHADLTGAPGTSGTVAMTKSGKGTFKYISAYASPGTLVPDKVVGTYDGKAKNAQLVISHGCRPFNNGAWCSPGFWRNATAGAWALVGKSPTELFNANVYDVWYGATFAADPTLATVLGDAPTYSGPPLAGTSGYPLNAFNATGAFLTNLIPGYQFDFAVMQAGSDDACPIDHFGNIKS